MANDNNNKVIKLDEEKAKKLSKEQTKKDLFERTNGKIRTTSVKNIVLILKTDKNLQGLFKFNEFTNEVDVVKDATLKTSIGTISITKGEYTDQVINAVELYIESAKKYQGAIFKNNVIDQGIINTAHMNSYNPIIDYMNEAYAEWDKKQRLDDTFVVFLGAPGNESTGFIPEI